MSVKKWDLIYELRTDTAFVDRVREQRAQAPTYGLALTPYPFASKTWWDAIDSGAIERHSVEGTITEAHPTNLPDRADFTMRTPDGAELTGTRHGDTSRYVDGLHIRLEYVTLPRSPDAPPELGTTADVVFAVWIEHSQKRTPYVHTVDPPFPGRLIFGG